MQPHFETPPKMTVSITDSCNLDCAHCYADCTRAAAPEELSIDEWIAFADYLVANDFIELYIEGGEPLQRPGLERLLAHCARKMMTMVRTHGTLLTEAVARQWQAFGVGRVFVDIMGANAATHDALTGVAGSFDLACAAVRHLVRAGIPTDMLIILHRRNYTELQDYLRLAHALGAERVGLLRLYPLGRARRRWAELALTLDEQQQAVAALEPPPGLVLMQSWHPKDANCCWQAATVNARGHSIGCPYLREYVDFGSIREMDFLDTWRNDRLYRQLRSGRVEPSCPDCHASEGTRGGCRSTAYAFHGRWTAPDPFCSRHNDHRVALDVLPIRLLPAGL